MKLYTTLFIIFLFSKLSLIAQLDIKSNPNIIAVKEGKYHVGNHVYSYQGIKELYKYYPTFIEKSKQASFLSTTGFIFVVGSGGLLIGGLAGSTSCSSTACFGSGYSILLAVPMGVVGLLLFKSSKNKKKQSIEILNSKLRQELEQNSSNIQIRPSKNGIGITISF